MLSGTQSTSPSHHRRQGKKEANRLPLSEEWHKKRSDSKMIYDRVTFLKQAELRGGHYRPLGFTSMLEAQKGCWPSSHPWCDEQYVFLKWEMCQMTVRNNSLVVESFSQWAYYKSYDTALLLLDTNGSYRLLEPVTYILHFFLQFINLFSSTTVLNVDVALW